MNRQNRLYIQYILILTLFSTTVTFSQTLSEEIDDIVKTEMKKRKVVGASLTLVDSSGIIFSKGYGFADKENSIPATAQTVYPFGSVSKVITMASVLRLHDKGKLNIDSTFINYVPTFQIKQHFTEKKPFTVFDLLTQQAGIPRTRLKDLYTDFANSTDFYKLIDEEKDNYLIAPPKYVYQYSDIGISMLGLLPSYITQTNYTDFVQKEIFKTFEMTSASFHKDSARGNYTKGYEKGKEARIFATRYLPAFGLQASAEDLGKFTYVFLNEGKNIEGKQVLSSEIINRSISRQNQETKLAYSNHLGLTWWRGDFYGYESVYHGGEQKPCMSMVRMLPQLKLGLVLVMNSDMNRDFLEVVTEKVLLSLMKAKNIPYNEKYYDKFKVEKAESFNQNIVQKYVGDYASSYGIIHIKNKGQKIKVNLISAKKKLNARLMNDSTLQLRYMVLGVYPVNVLRIFVEEVDGRKIIGTISTKTGRKIFGGESINFEKPKTAWDNISDKYSICNLSDKEYQLLKEIEVNEYKGIKVISGEGDIPDVEKFQFCIRPINDNLAIVQGIGGQGLLGETIKRFEKNGEEFIEICGYLAKKRK